MFSTALFSTVSVTSANSVGPVTFSLEMVIATSISNVAKTETVTLPS